MEPLKSHPLARRKPSMKIWTVVAASLAGGVMVGVSSAYWQYQQPPIEGLSEDESVVQDDGRLLVPPPLAPAGSPQPVASVPEDIYNFGEMRRGETGGHEFVITNKGRGDLELKLGSTSCKCTLSGLDNDRLAPGESANVRLTWEVKGKERAFEQSAKIMTNDPQRRLIVLRVRGQVVNPLQYQPEQLTFSQSSREAKTYEVTLYAKELDDLQITQSELEPDNSAEFIEIAVEPLSVAQQKFLGIRSALVVKVTAKPGLPAGQFEQTMTLHTNDPETPILRVPIRGTITGDVTLHPAGGRWKRVPGGADDELIGQWNWGEFRSGKAVSRRLMMHVRGPHREGITARLVSISPDFLEVTLGEPKPLGQQGSVTQIPLEITVPADAPSSANFGGPPQGEVSRIVLGTDHPQAKRIEVQIQFVLIP
jgi:hypothetical protein